MSSVIAAVPWANPESPMPWHYWGWPPLPGQSFWTLADLIVPILLATIVALVLCISIRCAAVGIGWAVYGLRLALLERRRPASSARVSRFVFVETSAGWVALGELAISRLAQHPQVQETPTQLRSRQLHLDQCELSGQRSALGSPGSMPADALLRRSCVHRSSRSKPGRLRYSSMRRTIDAVRQWVVGHCMRLRRTGIRSRRRGGVE